MYILLHYKLYNAAGTKGISHSFIVRRIVREESYIPRTGLPRGGKIINVYRE